MNIPNTNLPRVVIIGGGFGGLNLAKCLRGKKFQVVLIDKNNFHTFQPLLYQVATAGLEPSSIAYPLRKIFKKYEDFFFRMAEVERIDSDQKQIFTNIGSLEYDHLVIATGSTTNFFGNDEVESKSMSMKEVSEALDIRSLVLQNFENALLTNDLAERESLLNVAIVGGGPTGVELAGAIAELRKHILPADYPDLDFRRMQIHVLEAAPRVLASMSEQASKKAKKFLDEMGVQVWLDTRVCGYDGINIDCENGTEINASTLIWAAGVKGCPPSGLDASNITRGNRIQVDEFNHVGNEVYAIGDVAQIVSDETPHGHPMVAQVAMQQGKNLAKNLVRAGQEKPMKPFEYKDLGSMATIGRNRAVVDLPRFRFQGFFAWFVWMFIHIIQLVGFRNKLVVLFNWIHNYLRYSRDIRLIIRPFKR